MMAISQVIHDTVQDGKADPEELKYYKRCDDNDSEPDPEEVKYSTVKLMVNKCGKTDGDNDGNPDPPPGGG